jgi:hypothetical protein
VEKWEMTLEHVLALLLVMLLAHELEHAMVQMLVFWLEQELELLLVIE